MVRIHWHPPARAEVTARSLLGFQNYYGSLTLSVQKDPDKHPMPLAVIGAFFFPSLGRTREDPSSQLT